jgi:hypothetical protein
VAPRIAQVELLSSNSSSEAYPAVLILRRDEMGFVDTADRPRRSAGLN